MTSERNLYFMYGSCLCPAGKYRKHQQHKGGCCYSIIPNGEKATALWQLLEHHVAAEASVASLYTDS